VCAEEYAYCANKLRQNVGFGNMNTTSNCDVTNSGHETEMTTICHWMKLSPQENFLRTPLLVLVVRMKFSLNKRVRTV